jgi:hypothetical protein
MKSVWWWLSREGHGAVLDGGVHGCYGWQFDEEEMAREGQFERWYLMSKNYLNPIT